MYLIDSRKYWNRARINLRWKSIPPTSRAQQNAQSVETLFCSGPVLANFTEACHEFSGSVYVRESTTSSGFHNLQLLIVKLPSASNCVWAISAVDKLQHLTDDMLFPSTLYSWEPEQANKLVLPKRYILFTEAVYSFNPDTTIQSAVPSRSWFYTFLSHFVDTQYTMNGSPPKRNISTHKLFEIATECALCVSLRCPCANCCV